MTAGRTLCIRLARLLPVLLLVLWGARAAAQADPPGRVARLNHAQGSVVFSPAGDDEWTDAPLNRPLTRGDRLWSDRGSRGELQVGSSAVRMDGQTHLEIMALDDQAAQLSVTRGAVHARVRSLPEGENFEIDTPN
ncbi:MAG TPA: chromosome partitioning protein ParA, partial [Ramlibacter sp.]|nr:chromosome partitioning protein ParA [Ramlibacter sp.]